MSFIDGIFSGIAGAVRGALGMDDDGPAKHGPATAERPESLARSTSTRYDDQSSPSHSTFSLADHVAAAARTASTSPARTSLVDQLRENSARRYATPDSGSPTRGAEPPASTARPTTETTTTSGYATGQAHGTAQARVFDASSRSEYGTADSLRDGSDAATAARNVQRGLDYFASTFGRDGVDGAGSGVDILIDDHSTDDTGDERFKGNGGYYAMDDGTGTLREAIHFGSGTSYDAARGLVDQQSMLHADDLSIHELVHGIIRKETGHLGGDADEAGATNEGIADVMAAAATRDWTIGEDMYTDRSSYRKMRDIANPDDPTAVHGLWTSMTQLQATREAGKQVEEHWASGVVSTAAYRVQQRFGGEPGWQVVERVFYDAIDNGRLGDMSFASVAAGLRTSAAAVYGSGSSVDQVFDEELRRAGL